MVFTLWFLSACQASPDGAASLRLTEARPVWKDQQLGIEAGIQFAPAPAVLEALHHGVVIPLRVRVRVHPRHVTLAGADRTRSHRFEIRYLPLTNAYELHDLRGNTTNRYPRLSMLLDALAERHWMDIHLTEADLRRGAWRVDARIDIDRTRVPSPMRVMVWLDQDWRPAAPAQRWRIDAQQ